MTVDVSSLLTVKLVVKSLWSARVVVEPMAGLYVFPTRLPVRLTPPDTAR